MKFILKRPILFSNALKGGVFGYFILHPLNMFVSELMHPHEGGILHFHTFNEALIHATNAFSQMMIPWAATFTFVGVLIGIYYGSLMVKLKTSHDYLEETVAERTKELTQANIELKSVDRLKGDIISNVSHELRTPITILQAAISLLTEEEEEETKKQLVDMSLKALSRQNQIVDDLLAAGRLKKKNIELNFAPVDIGHVLTLAYSKLKHLADEKSIEMAFKLEDNLPTIKADFNQLEHVFRNLIHNAFKFCEKGCEVSIETKKTKDTVAVYVNDCGIGISEDRLNHIFEPLYQGDPTSTRSYEGTGMGLAVAKEIVEAHGGRITAESKVGKGSSFCVTIPIYSE